MSEIPAEAVQAATQALQQISCPHTLGWSCANCRARAAVEAAAPFIAEHIALALEERGDAIALDCWCYDTAADLAREAFPKGADQ